MLGIFVVEILIKLIAEGSRPWRYFRDPFNCFDFAIVAVTLLPFGNQYITVLRLFNQGIKMFSCGPMRTTLTIDPDVGKLLEQEAQRSRKPFKQVVNEALRRGLTRVAVRPRKLQLKVHDSRLHAGYDPRSFNALSDELEDAAVLRKSKR